MLIEVSRCYRLDAFHPLGTPAAAFIACFFEGHVMDASPITECAGVAWLSAPNTASTAWSSTERATRHRREFLRVEWHVVSNPVVADCTT